MKRYNLPAILNGKPTINKLPRYNTIGNEEIQAVSKVLKTGKLSGFLGFQSKEFYGGEKIQLLEKLWCKKFNTKYSITMNSATSCLYSSIGAIGVNPGDEIIVTPTTMTATASGIVLYGCIPIFADICPKTFCINPRDVEEKITSKTKAIIATNIYGFSAEWIELRKIAKKYKIFLIEDAAQSYGVMYDKKKSGTLGDIGIYSLNRHKHIHTGEGGVCVTNNRKLADRLRLIRNHAEAVIKNKKNKNLKNLIGFNYRMTEIEATIAIEQLKKLNNLIYRRKKQSNKIVKLFKRFDFIEFSYSNNAICDSKICCKKNFKKNNDHSYYYIPFKYIKKKDELTRNQFVESLKKEGVPVEIGGYYPLYFQPMYQSKVGFGDKNYPFVLNSKISYKKGLCPESEKAYLKDMFYFGIQNYDLENFNFKKIEIAINKIIKNKEKIKKYFEKKN
jgi:dTDP-4-amino-4,6-dideoxygalactose transaminase